MHQLPHKRHASPCPCHRRTPVTPPHHQARAIAHATVDDLVRDKEGEIVRRSNLYHSKRRTKSHVTMAEDYVSAEQIMRMSCKAKARSARKGYF